MTSAVQGQQSRVDLHPTQAMQNSSEKLAKKLAGILIITAIALAAIAAVGGIVALTVFFPHVMIPILAATIFFGGMLWNG